MAANIGEVVMLCNGLSSSRVTERKTSADRLLERLRDPDLQIAIDESGKTKTKTSFSWDAIINAVFIYVGTEVEKSKASPHLNDDTIARKMQVTSNTFRGVVNFAEKRGPRLKAGNIYKHICAVISDKAAQKWFCNDYTNVLVKNFLSVELHRNEITPKLWHELVCIYCSCIMVPPPNGDISIFAQALCLLTSLAGDKSFLRGNDLFKFFGEVFKDVRDYKNETYVLHLVNALNNCHLHFASDNRGQLCILGEDLFPLLLPLWNKTSSSLKDKLIDFFRIQVDIHHPCGVHLEDDGAWSSNEEFWKKCLRKLYEAICNDFQQLIGKLKWSGNADLAQKSNFIELAVATYHQIFFLQTQKHEPDVPSHPDGSSRKKHKIESKWQAVIDGISMVSSPTACVAWLQFLAVFIKKHPHSFPPSEYSTILHCLHQAMVHCKRSDVLGFVMQALYCLADKSRHIRSTVPERKENAQRSNEKEIDSIWRNIWFETLKAIHSRHVNDYGYNLLAVILNRLLYTPSKDTYNILFSAGVKISSGSLKFLVSLLKRCPIPDKPSSNVEIYNDDKSSKYLVRRKLIEFAIPDADVSTGRKNFIKLISDLSKESMQAAAITIMFTLQKHGTALAEKFEGLISWKSTDGPDDYGITMKEIGDLYLKSTFCGASGELNEEEISRLKSKRYCRVGLVPELSDFLVKRCTSLTETIINLHKDEEFRQACGKSCPYSCVWLDISCKYLSIFQSILFLLLYINDTSSDQLSNALTDSIKVLLSSSVSTVSRIYDNSNIDEDTRDSAVLNLLSYVNHFFDKIDAVGLSSERFLKLFPKSFMELLFNITSGQLQPNNLASKFHTTDFGSSSGSSTTMGDIDDLMETNDRSCTQRQISMQSQRRGNQCDPGDSPMPKPDCVRIEASKLLCHFAFVQEPMHHIKDRSLQDAFIDFLDDKFDSQRIVTFQILKIVINHLDKHSFILSTADLEVIFNCIRIYISDWRSFQPACEESLALLRSMMRFLKAPNQHSDDQYTEVRRIAMTVISAVWILREDKYCPTVRLMLLNCLVEVMQVDPDNLWSKIDVSKQSRKTGSKEPETTTMEDCLLQLLTDRSHLVRIKAAECVRKLFRSPNGLPVTPSQQQSVFNKVADALTELIIIKDNLTDFEIDDVSANRAAALLYVLKEVACSSTVCEKKAIALLFHDYKEKFLDIKLVGKVFREISHEKGFSDPVQYLKEHFGFLCKDWMKRGFPVVQFPSIVVEMKIKSFLRSFSREIIPYVILYWDQASFDSIKEKLELDDPWTDLVIENFDRIIVFLLPYYACQSKQMQRGKEDENKLLEMEADRKRAKAAYEFLESALTKEVIDNLLVKRFDDIVVELFLRMFDPPAEESDASQFMSDTDAAPNPPFFTSFAVKGTLEYLAACHCNKSILEVLSLKKDSIQKILLALSTSVTKAKTEREKVRMLCSYRLFVLLLLDDLQNGLGRNWAYFVHDVIYRCCHWLNYYYQNGSDDAFFRCVYHVLRKIAETSLVCCSEEFGCHIFIIVNTLTKFVKRGGTQGRKALNLLNFIVIENCEAIRSFLLDLPPFPDAPAFLELSKKLHSIKQEDDTRDEFDDLKILYHKELISIEALNSFLHLLKRDKNFIERFLEVKKDGNITVLEIISRLMELASLLDKCQDKDPDRKIRLAIGRCIGEIGPVDLHSLVLPTPEDDISKEDEAYFGSNNSAYRYHMVLDKLCSLLTHESMEVASAAASSLKNALHTKFGIQHLNLYDVGSEEKPNFFKYSQPFKPSKPKRGSQHTQDSQPNTKPSVADFVARVGGAHLWEPGLMVYEDWIKELSWTLALSGSVQDEILVQVAPVCKLDLSFAALLLPLLIHNVLLNCTDELRSMLSSLVNRFVSQYLSKGNRPSIISTRRTESHQKVSRPGGKEKAGRTIINVVNYLRKQDKPLPNSKAVNTKWDNNFWLDINYLDLARMAFECSSFFAAVMFTEIWCDIQRLDSTNLLETEESCMSSQGTQLEALSDQSGDSNLKTSYQRLLFEAYRSIGEPDAVYGVSTGYLSDVPTRVKAYEYEEDFGKALLIQDLQMDKNENSGSLTLAQSLGKAGLNQILLTYMNGMDRSLVEDKDAFEELQFEACWRNGVWDLDSHTRSTMNEKTNFSGAIFDSIVTLKEGDANAFASLIDEARISLLASNVIDGNVSSAYLYEFLSKMNAITELEMYGKEYFSKNVLPGMAKRTLPNDFKFYELSLSLRAAALKVTLQRETQKPSENIPIREDIGREAYSHLLRSAVLARQARRFQVCERHLHDIDKLQTMVEIPLDWKIEQAKMFWDRGEKNRAMHHLHSLIRNCEKVIMTNGKDPRLADLYPAALGIYGHWLAETRSENPGIIIENYMEQAACLLEDSQCTLSESPSEAYYLLAKYADSQYEGIKEYIKSSSFENKQTVIKKVKDEINRLNEMGNVNTSTRYYRSLAAQCKEDEEELHRILNDRKQFLHKTLENYVRCLCSGDTYDLRIFRLCSVWLENSHEVSVNQIIKSCISKMESRKFIPLMYQLAARLDSGDAKETQLFNETLEQLIEKAAREHPYHVTVIIMALCNVENETEIQSNVGLSRRSSKLSKKEASSKTKGTDQSRAQSAKSILGKLRRANPSLIESIELVMTAYNELAYHDIQHLKRSTGKFELPSKLLLRKLKDVKNFPVPTLEIPVDPSCKYSNVTYIAGFDKTFTHCGGINLPKVITCIGSDGRRRRQLVKGKDDLRQDAVMQQVFGMVNQLLKENKETKKRELRIRTYKVMPLSQRSGIVEWCENTVPLGEYLIGSRGIGGAHSRYHPTDWTAAECRKRITEAANSNDKNSRFTAFQEIVKNFRPVFRHFFYEKFTDPAEWYTKRLAYTRSLASSSIVGYVVGLGDRHVQNILIDFITAELVHIDLGIAFEQGKQLPTPETIPFRLTRDLVDGMGIAGVEGVFRRCCEKVMEVMRTSQEAIQTIVEVLLYDPLYVWTLSPLKAVQVQQKTTDYGCDTAHNMSANGDDNLENLLEELQSVQPQADHTKNKMAQRVLIRLKQKLDGNEAGSFLSTEGQVNFLIQAARDPKNLCRVFPGWQPWV